jgi:hypothetical protein
VKEKPGNEKARSVASRIGVGLDRVENQARPLSPEQHGDIPHGYLVVLLV